MANPKSAKSKATVPEQVEVELLKPHRHRGVQHPPGTKIEVTPQQAAWLERQQVAKGVQA